jgi:hypothetical protein
VFAIFDVFIIGVPFLTLSIGRGGASQTRRLILLISGGWRPPDVRPSGAGLSLGTSMPSGARHAVAGDTTPGLRLCPCTWATGWVTGLTARRLEGVGCHGHLLGHRPQETDECTGHGHHDWVGMCASGEQAAIALTKPHRCLPAAGLDDGGRVFPASLQVSADVRGVARGPGAFDQDATRRGGARCGARTLPTPRSTRVCRGGQASVLHQRCGVSEAGEVAQRRAQRDGHRARPPA